MNIRSIGSIVGGFLLAAALQAENAATDSEADSDQPKVNLWPLFTVDQNHYNVLGLNHRVETDEDVPPPPQKKTAKDEKKAKSNGKQAPADGEEAEEDPMHCLGLFPLYAQFWNREDRYIVSFPLFWHGNTPESWYLNLCGPLYHYYHDRNDGSVYNAFVWPVAEYEFDRTGHLDSWHFWPLVSVNNGWPSVLNFDPDHISMLLLFNWNCETHDAAGLPRLNRYHPVKDDCKLRWTVRKSSNAVFFPLWFQTAEEWAVWKPGTDGKKLSDAAATLTRLENRKSGHRRHWSFRPEMTATEQKTAEEQLRQLATELKLKIELNKEQKPDWTAFRRQLAEKYTQTLPYRHIFCLPLFYDYEALNGETKWNTFFFLAGGRNGKDASMFHLLEYLYRYEREGQTRSQFIFPFIMTQTAPDRHTFSFLWRVYDRTVTPEKVSGHIMFIPF